MSNQVSVYLSTPLIPLAHLANWAFRHSLRGAYSVDQFQRKTKLLKKSREAALLLRAQQHRTILHRNADAVEDGLLTPFPQTGYSLKRGRFSMRRGAAGSVTSSQGYAHVPGGQMPPVSEDAAPPRGARAPTAGDSLRTPLLDDEAKATE